MRYDLIVPGRCSAALIALACAACIGSGDRDSLYGCGAIDPGGGPDDGDPQLRLTSPNGGEVWASGHVAPVTWTSNS